LGKDSASVALANPVRADPAKRLCKVVEKLPMQRDHISVAPVAAHVVVKISQTLCQGRGLPYRDTITGCAVPNTAKQIALDFGRSHVASASHLARYSFSAWAVIHERERSSLAASASRPARMAAGKVTFVAIFCGEVSMCISCHTMKQNARVIEPDLMLCEYVRDCAVV